ncbi:MAG: alpha-hydroxy-acid oxidizing protein [Desulfovibrio sp.]|nr:alpha-hydroxy-acid oxidizing protein [Desulfovibrio sp.]
MKDIRSKAKELMKGSCRLCPVCDGRACVGEVPGMGGLGYAFRNNVAALSDITLNMRLVHDVREPDPATAWLGLELSMPVVAAPIGGTFNFNDAVTEDDYIHAVLDGCRAAGVIGCTGDGVPSVIINSAVSAIKNAQGHGIPFIKPWESGEFDEKMELAIASGCPVMGMDIDAAGLTTLRKMGRPVGPKTLKELTKIIEKAKKAGVKFIVKGVMTVQDAYNVVEAGADCLVVSNHGGRVFGAAPGTAQVLPAIARAVRGKISVMVDGGVRNGADVFKMLALGADIVGMGRPVTIAAIGGGSEGVNTWLTMVKNELVQTMILTGCRDIKAIDEAAIFVPQR